MHTQNCNTVYYHHANCQFCLHLSTGNAIKNANTPIMDRLSESTEGFVTLDASG